jgi:tetratricopeptide (TPR) repeat protein
VPSAPAPIHAPPGVRRRTLRAAIDVFLGLALMVLALSFHAPLPQTPIQDDGPVALEHPSVRDGVPSWSRAPFYAESYRPIWRPLATLTLRWNWLASPAATAPDAGALRMAHTAMTRTNVALLAMLGVLAFLFLRLLRFGPAVAFALCAILVVHPAGVESVSVLAGRSELLANGILLAALALYTGAIARRASPFAGHGPGASARGTTGGLWAAWGAAFFLALLGHESALILPVLVLGYEATGGTGDRARRAAAALLLALLVAGVWALCREGVLHALPWELRRNVATDYLRALDGGERVRLALDLPRLYLALLLGVAPVLPDYAHLLARPADAPDIVLGQPSTYGVHVPGAVAIALGALVLAATFAIFFILRRRETRAAFGAWMLGVGLLFSLPLLASNGHVASARHLLLPLLGLLMLVGGLYEALARALRARAGAGIARFGVPLVAGLLALGALALGATRTRDTHRSWISQAAVMERLAEAAPNSPEIPAYRGSLAMARGDLDQAARYFETSIGFFPRNPRVLLNLGLIRAQQQQYSLAMRILHDTAILSDRVMPRSSVAAKAHLSLGTLFGWQSQDPAALEEFKKALAADSTNVTALASAGVIEAMSLDTARDGIRRLNRALERDPEGRELGAMAKRVREVRDRAVFYFTRIAPDREAYETGMQPPDSASIPAESSRAGSE